MDRNTVWWRILHLEPAMWRGVVVAVLALLASFGVYVAPGLSDNLVLLIVAVATIAQAIWTRPAVTANAKVVVWAPEPVTQPAHVQPGEAVTQASDRKIIDAANDTPNR